MTNTPSPQPPPRGWGHRALDAGRGALMGIAETIPGVSGGTIALMTGVYETILNSVGHAITAARVGAVDVVRGRGLSRAFESLRRVHWEVMVPLVLAMIVALLSSARVMENLVHDHPQVMRGLFFGLVLASLMVPYRLAANAQKPGQSARRWGPLDFAIAGGAAVAAFVVVSLPRGELTPTPWILVPAGAIAVSALVLPGLSGSFLLLAMGLYEPTLAAVNDSDWGYLAFFALGFVLGLISVVKGLQWLLHHHRRVTLVILTGVMAGSLRALWPWIDEENRALAPSGAIAMPVLAVLAGVALVTAVVLAEHRLGSRASTDQPDAPND